MVIHIHNKAFIEIRLRPGIATPLVVVGQRFSLPCIAIRLITATRDFIHKTGGTQRIAMPSKEDRATATGDLHKNCVKIGRAVPEMCSRTDRQTDKLIAIFRSPTGSE